GRDIDIETASELAQMPAVMFAPMALAIAADLALAGAVEVADLHLQLAGAPIGRAFDLVAQAKRGPGGKAQDHALGDDLLAIQHQAQMLHALAIPGTPE